MIGTRLSPQAIESGLQSIIARVTTSKGHCHVAFGLGSCQQPRRRLSNLRSPSVSIAKEECAACQTDRLRQVDANLLEDSKAPPAPRVAYTGPVSFPGNHLTFGCSYLSGAGKFAALKWRVGEVMGPGASTPKPDTRVRAWPASSARLCDTSVCQYLLASCRQTWPDVWASQPAIVAKSSGAGCASHRTSQYICRWTVA